MLKSTVQQDLKTAMKSGNAPERDALRLLLAAITSAEKAEGRDLTEPEAEAVVTRLVKQANNSIEEYKRLDQADTVAKLESELAIYKRYAPEQMGEDQVRALVAEAVAEAGATGPQDMGKVMKLVMPKVQGKADGGVVNRIVKEQLSK